MNFNIEFKQQESKRLIQFKNKWIEQNIKMGGDKKVIEFIAAILYHGGNGVTAEDSIETIRCLFEAGYCYHFAKTLEDAFPGGQICYCYNFGHIVYCYEGVAYDIGGVSDAEHEMYIPISELGDAINDFKHIPGVEYTITEDKVWEIGEKCKHNKTYINAISAYDQEIVDRTRAICEAIPKTKYVQSKTDYTIIKNRLTKNFTDGYITREQFHKFMEENCYEIGISYPLIQRIEREKQQQLNQKQ